MKKCLFTVLLLSFVVTSAMAQQSSKISPRLQDAVENISVDETITAWIYFQDKGPAVETALQAAAAALTEKAYQRRLRNRGATNLVDAKDLPVYAAYLQGIKNDVVKVRHKSRWLNAVSVEIKKSALNNVAALSYVKKIDLLRKFRNDRTYEEQAIPERLKDSRQGLEKTSALDYGASLTQNAQIGVPAMHDLGYDGSGILIGMLDSGFNNLQHPGMDHLSILATWDFVNGDENVADQPGQMGSGNHGAYTLSALAGFAEGQLIGPAYNADFVLAKTENTESETNAEEDWWVAGAEWADSHGVDIISSSLAYREFDFGQNSYTWEDMNGDIALVTIAADIAASRGILVVNSAANEGIPSPGENTIWAPADGDSVLAIGAVDANGNIAGFSSRGPSADGRIKPDVSAMGVFTVCCSAITTNYIAVNGTSLSCPLVAGAAALLLQAHPNLTNMDIYDLLRNTASQASTPDNNYGYGIIDVSAASNAVVGIEVEDNVVRDFELLPVYPNPFNPQTSIQFSLDKTADIELAIFNTLGQQITTLYSGQKPSGRHEFPWEASGNPSGLYFVVLSADGQKQVQKAVLLK